MNIPSFIAMAIATTVFGLFGFIGSNKRKKNQGFYGSMKLVFFISLIFMILHVFTIF